MLIKMNITVLNIMLAKKVDMTLTTLSENLKPYVRSLFFLRSK